jgi:hypothetical protein
MKVSMFKKIFVFVMLSVTFGVDVPVKNQDFEKHELVQGNDVLAGSEVPDGGIERELKHELVHGNGDKHVVHDIEGAVLLAGSEVLDERKARKLAKG